MTVGELINRLIQLPQDAVVYLPCHEEAKSVEYDCESNEVEISYEEQVVNTQTKSDIHLLDGILESTMMDMMKRINDVKFLSTNRKD